MYNTFFNSKFSFNLFKKSSAIFFSFVKDKNDLENTIAPGKLGNLLFK